MSGWKHIATAPTQEEILARWCYTYLDDRSPTIGYSLGEISHDGWFRGHEGRHPPGIFTHWFDFGNGKPMPDAPEVE